MVGHRDCGPVADLDPPQPVVNQVMFCVRAGVPKFWGGDSWRSNRFVPTTPAAWKLVTGGDSQRHLHLL